MRPESGMFIGWETWSKVLCQIHANRQNTVVCKAATVESRLLVLAR